MIGDPLDHLHNPVIAGVDAMSALAVVGWWFEILHGPIGTITTALAGLWYAYNLYQAIKRHKK